MKNRIAIVTGLTSFIGLVLGKYLLEKGFFVFAVIRKESEYKLNQIEKQERLRIIYSDIYSLNSIVSHIKEADLFFHLAWDGTGIKDRYDKLIQKRNIAVTLNAIEISSQLNCKCFVNAGSQAEYGFIEGIITENSECNPITEYGKAKLEVFQKGEKLAKSLGIKFVHLRIFSIYGSGDHEWTLVINSLKKMLMNDILKLSACTQKWNYIYVDDAVQQIIRVAEQALSKEDFVSEIFHIASKDTRILKEFVGIMYQLTGSKSLIEYNISSENLLSIEPSISNLEKFIGTMKYISFQDGVKNIIRYIVYSL
jgi:nucleoside-diphosphate-sugar epimerase